MVEEPALCLVLCEERLLLQEFSPRKGQHLGPTPCNDAANTVHFLQTDLAELAPLHAAGRDANIKHPLLD